MVGQSKVVIRSEHDPPLSLNGDDGVLGFGDGFEIGVQPLCLDFIGPGELPALLEESDVGVQGVTRHGTSRGAKWT
jgi:hypothetical protein